MKTKIKKEYNKGNITPVRLFPTLYNIKPCINVNHPELHPDSYAYKEYWAEQEKRCLEGFWFEDKKGNLGGWRYMPGNLYYYVNFCVIEDEDDKGNTVAIIQPLLRDVEWIFSYGWLTARGFSGFSEDKEYTCHRIVHKLEKGHILTPKEEREVKLIKNIYKEDGTLKKYIEARKYLEQTFDKPLGLPLYQNTALNLFILGSRGSGKSFFVGNAIIGHEFNFYGKKYYDDEYLKDPSPVEIFVGAALASKSSDLLKKFSKTQERHKKNYGAWGKHEDFIPGYFYNNTTGSLQPNNSKSPYRHEYKYQEGGTWMTGGTGTTLKHGVYTSENPQAAVGTRPTVMVIEEVGLMNNLLEVHGANTTCMVRRTKFGSAVYLGTGGNIEKIVESKIVFEDPEAYEFVEYPDLWENRSKPIGLFLPAYYVDNSFKDENGNTDLEAALNEELYQRHIREQASNSSAIDQYMMSRPIFPSEMFLSPTANIFPTAKLREREAQLENKKEWELFASIGDLNWTDNTCRTVKWQEDITPRRLSRPITRMNLDSYKHGLNGAIVIYEHPEDGTPNPTYRKSLYKVVYDPVKDDGEGTSLGSILVYKSYTEDNWNMGIQDGIVAEWIGRFDQVYDMHELCLKLAYYYNALILVENNLPGFIRYCKTKNHVHKLMLSPYEAISKGQITVSKKYEFGVTMNKQLSIHCEHLIRQWLLEDWKTLSDGKVLTTIDKIKSPRLLKELIAYNRDDNYDHISSLKLLMLWLSQEKEQVFKQADLDNERDNYADLGSIIKSNVNNIYNTKNNPWYV